MNPRELCLECDRNKPEKDDSFFCNDCKKKIIKRCTIYHYKLQNNLYSADIKIQNY